MADDKTLRLRPLGTMDLLDETAELFRGNFWLLVGIVGIAIIPASLLYPRSGMSADNPSPSAWAGALLFYLLYFSIVHPALTGALACAISERYLLRPASVLGSYKHILRRSTFPKLMGASVLVVLILIGLLAVGIVAAALVLAFTCPPAQGGFGKSGTLATLYQCSVLVLVCVPAGWFFIVSRFASAVVVIESRSSWTAIRRSLSLSKGMGLRMFWTIVPLWAGIVAIQYYTRVGLVSASEQGFFGAARFSHHAVPAMIAVAQNLIGLVLGSSLSIMVVLFYYDARVRKEGFDLVMLAEQLDGGGQRPTFGEIAHLREPDESWRTDVQDNAVETSKHESV